MGYTTEFDGKLKFKNPLTAEQEIYLKTILPDNDYQDTDDHPDWITPDGYRGYIQLEICEDKTGIQWDGSEKFRNSVEAVNTVVMTMQAKFPDFELEGELQAQGEEMTDRWSLIIVDGKAFRKELIMSSDVITCPHCEEKIILSDLTN